MFRKLTLFTATLCFSVAVATPTNIDAEHVSIIPNTKPHSVTVSRGCRPLRTITAIATAYDVSIESCGKTDGITTSGFNLTGHHWDTARCVAADWRVFPKGTLLYIEFEGATEYDGVYVVRDTGGDIKHNRIDVFIETRQGCLNFGRRKARVTVL